MSRKDRRRWRRNDALSNISMPVTAAAFDKAGDARDFWTERAVSHDEEVALTWYDIGEALLIHTEPGSPPARKYGVCTVLIPALGARRTVNGLQAKGLPFPNQREGRPFSTCALAFSESWTEAH